MDLQLLSFLLIGTWLGLGCCENNCSYVELMKAIIGNFPSKDVRPAMIWTNQTVVNLDLTLYSIVDLDMQKQIITTYVWFSMSWQNDFIKWNPATYCNITNVVVSDTLVWKPDLYIYEMVEDEDKSPKINYLKIRYDGTVTNSKPLRIVGSCSMQNFKFPFDEQNCTLSFGSYVYNDYEMFMTNKTDSSAVTSNSKSIFSSKGDWSLVNIIVGNKPLPNGNFNRVTFEIHIKRNPVIYIFNLIIPACLLVILDIASMFMEVGTEGRLTFKVTIVLGFSVLLLILSSILPNSDTPPMLGIFFCVCMIMMVLSIGGSICTASMVAKCATQTIVPPWMKKWILRYLACVLCYKTKFIKEHLVTVVANIHTCEHDQKLTKLELQENGMNLKDDDPITTAVQILKKMLVGIRKIHHEIAVSKHKDHSSSEWYIAAMVVDRLFLIIYLITVVITVSLVINAWVNAF